MIILRIIRIILYSFKTYNDLINSQPIDYLFSLGGDGTFLDAANLIKNLIFLSLELIREESDSSRELIKLILKNRFLFRKGDYEIEERILLMLSHSDIPTAPRVHYALNDITIALVWIIPLILFMFGLMKKRLIPIGQTVLLSLRLPALPPTRSVAAVPIIVPL